MQGELKALRYFHEFLTNDMPPHKYGKYLSQITKMATKVNRKAVPIRLGTLSK
jgi:hypothetical protein